MENKISIPQTHIIIFIIAFFYLASSILYPRGSYPGRLSNFLDLLGFLALQFSLHYKVEQKTLKFDTLIENKIKGDPVKLFLCLGVFLQ